MCHKCSVQQLVHNELVVKTFNDNADDSMAFSRVVEALVTHCECLSSTQHFQRHVRL